ncbi:MAG: hypothetical protein WCH43_03290 [Verrucomicrobiota bacterium]
MIKALDIWLPAYLRQTRKTRKTKGIRHLLLCVCDHFEPFHHVKKEKAIARVELWGDEFPKLTKPFLDSGGGAPKHTFFYPIEQYDEDILTPLAQLCRATGCEVEFHLHHNHDTAANLRVTLDRGKQDLLRHGLLSRDEKGQTRYGFIHGNWALDNSHPRGEHCGVRNELQVLNETGCYADFTMPSAPGRTQTQTINSLYYARGTNEPKSHDRNIIPAEVGKKPSGDLLLVQGPLGLNWNKRKLGCLPGIENGDLTGKNPPTLERLRLWLDLNIHVKGRPEWLFVKLHTHGAIPPNSSLFLGAQMQQFHRDLAAFAADNTGFRYHYVTAREMVNILHAAEDGHQGDPDEFRDYRYQSLISKDRRE